MRSLSGRYHIDAEFFAKNDIHIHIPEGAVPKDGPSAGITMATAILSAVTEIPVRADVAMTGEITLRGRVLPIGGLKEKLLAANGAGMHTVIVPAENQAGCRGDFRGDQTGHGDCVCGVDAGCTEGGTGACVRKEQIWLSNRRNLEAVCGITSKLPENAYPEVAFAGKSNVGKSSLINSLDEPQGAGAYELVSRARHRRSIFTVSIRQSILVDLPGYGYAKVPQSEKEKWGKLIERYLHGSKQLTRCLSAD